MTDRQADNQRLGYRIVGATVGVMLLIAVASTGYFAFFFDANTLKPRIVAAVHHYTGRALTIDGDLTIVLLPSPHVTLKQIFLAEAPGFGDHAFAEIGVVSIYLRLLPLLRRQFEIREIVLEQPHLHLQKNKTGESNWADLLQKRSSQVQSPDQDVSAAGVVIRSLRIEGGELTFDDKAANRRVIASNLNLRADGFGRASKATIEVKADVLGEQPKFKGVLALSGQVAANGDASLYNIDELRLRFDGTAAAPVEFTLLANGKGEYAGAHENVSGTLNVELKDTAGQVAANAQGTSNLDAGALPHIDAQLTVPEFSPRQILKRFGKEVPAMRDNSALTHARFSIHVVGDQARLVLRPTGQLDDSALNGQITLQDWSEHPMIRFELAVDQINLDRYRPPQSSGAPAPDTQDAISKISNDELRALGLNIRGDVRIGKITLNGDRTDNFVARLEWNP